MRQQLQKKLLIDLQLSSVWQSLLYKTLITEINTMKGLSAPHEWSSEMCTVAL